MFTPTPEELKELGFKKRPQVALDCGFYQDYNFMPNTDFTIVATLEVLDTGTKWLWMLELEMDCIELTLSSRSDLETLIKILK